MIPNIQLNEQNMLKARRLAFFISVTKAILFFVFDILLILVVYTFFLGSIVSGLALGVFSLVVIFFKLLDFLKKVSEIKQKLG